MNLEELIQKARNGDISAMIQVGHAYGENNDFQEAAIMYDMAADAGNLLGALFSMQSHTILGITSEMLSLWDDALQDWNRAFQMANKVLESPSIDQDNKETAYKTIHDAIYHSAFDYYCKNDFIKASQYLSKLDCSGYSKQGLLKGQCMVQIADRTDDSVALQEAFCFLKPFGQRCPSEIFQGLSECEEIVLAEGYINLHFFYLPKEPDVARNVLLLVYEVVKTSKMKEILEELLGHFRKKCSVAISI